MKVGIITHYFHPHTGGIEKVAQAHAEGLTKNGHHVTVMTTNVGSDKTCETMDGYDIVRYNARNPLESYGIPYPVPSPIDCIRKTRDAFNDNYDILHVHGFSYLTSAIPIFLKASSESPILLHHHAPFIKYGPLLDYLEWLNDVIVGRALLERADHRLAASENIAQYMTELCGKKTDVIYNGVDTKKFSPKIAPTERELLYVGRLTPKKGIKRLLKVINILGDNSDAPSIRVVGGGKMAEKMEYMASSSDILKFEGFVDEVRLAELYSRACALVVPELKNDAFPTLTILEALASGTPPILVRDNIGAPGFSEGETYLHAKPSPQAFADAIVNFSDHPALRDKMGLWARKAAVDYYDWENRIYELEAKYREVISMGK